MTFSTSIDKTVRKKTIGAFVLFTVVPLFLLFNGVETWKWLVGCYVLFMLLLLAFTYAFRPQQYIVSGENIIIKRLIGNVQINTRDIVRIDPIHHNLLAASQKGGAFGYFGKFHTDLGLIYFYATRTNHFVLLTKADNTKIILTPDQRDEFIEEMEKGVRLRRMPWQK